MGLSVVNLIAPSLPTVIANLSAVSLSSVNLPTAYLPASDLSAGNFTIADLPTVLPPGLGIQVSKAPPANPRG